MDANNMKEESKRFANQLISAKPADLESAVDQFFHPHASFDTDHVAVRGTRQLKKILKLSSWVRNQSAQLIDEPQYDSRTQSMKFSSTLHYVSPTIPSYVPLHAQLSGHKTSVRWNFTAYVTKNNDDQKFYVSKLKGSRWDVSPLERIIPQWILRPIVTFLALAFVTIVSFLQAHKGESITHVASAAMTESFAFIWSLLLSESGKRQAQADKLRGQAVPQLKQYYQQASSFAVDTASKVQSDLEARAKSAGIPVDDYKQRAAQAVSDLAENVEARAKAAGIPVEEYRKQAEAAIEELKKRAGEMGDYLEGKAGEVKDQAEGAAKDVQKKAGKQDKRTRENSNQTSQDKPHTIVTGEEAGRPADQRAKEIRAEFAEIPHTPLGGHDPTAPNAPSFAAAAAL